MNHLMKKQNMMEAMQIIAEFADKFPLLSVNEINFYELAKFYQKDPKDFISTVVFLDCMKHINEKSEKTVSYFINLDDVSKIKIRKKQQQWHFEVYKNSKEKMNLQHMYTHLF